MKTKSYLLLVFALIFLGCNQDTGSSTSTSASVQEICGTDEIFSNPATFCQIQQALLVPKCVRCHTGGRFNIGSTGDYQSLFNLGWIEAGDLDDSTMFTRMEAGQITDTVITTEELEAVESWILDGAPNN